MLLARHLYYRWRCRNTNEQNYNNVCFQQEKGATLGESLPL